MGKYNLQSEFLDDAIINAELMVKIGGWRERFH